MQKKWLLAAMLSLSGTAQAHEVWIERDGDGPARIYLGEPAEAPPPGGDPEFVKLKAPRLLSNPDAVLVRKTGFIEAAVPAGDVRASDDSVFAPWGPEGKKESVVYYARAGRSDPRALLPMEIVPAAANANRFILKRAAKPVAGAKVTVIAPDRSSRDLTTDASGAIDVPVAAPGRYLLSTAQKDEAGGTVAGGRVDILHRIATTTFVAP